MLWTDPRKVSVYVWKQFDFVDIYLPDVTLICRIDDNLLRNLFMTSKNEFFNSRIESAAYKSKSLLKPLFNDVLGLIFYFKNILSLAFLFQRHFAAL